MSMSPRRVNESPFFLIFLKSFISSTLNVSLTNENGEKRKSLRYSFFSKVDAANG